MKKDIKFPLYFFSIFSVFAFYITNRFTAIVETADGNVLTNISFAFDNLFSELSAEPFRLTFTKTCLIASFVAAILVWLIFLYRFIGAKKYMRGEEYGSAEYGGQKERQHYFDKDEDNNIILSATERLSMSSRVPNPAYDRNKNVLVVGGSGSGKTRFVVKPNLMQLHSSYVITDPKGTLLPETGRMFADNGFDVRSLNTINFKKSLHYNPLVYIKSEKDILKLVNVLIENTKGEGDKSGEDFWVKAERLLYQALISYLYYEAPLSDRNIPTLSDMLDACDAKDDDEDFQSPVDIIFEELAEEKPKCFAVKQYTKFKKAAGKTLKSILISCAARLAPFDIEELRELMMYDELALDEIGDRKTAFYVIMSDTDSTFSFLVAMMFYQMFNLLCDKADDEYGGRLPFHVRCILDEFANIGKIPNFERLISTIRSREISAMIILQSLSQLTPVYKEDAETIQDCCDSTIFLGGKSQKTTEAISKSVGKMTLDNTNYNETRGEHGNYSINNSNLGRDLIDPSEVGRLPRSQCLVLITGEKPFKSRKYNLKSHKRYKQLSDYDKNNLYDITQQEKLRKEHFFDSINEIEQIDLSELNDLVA